MAKYCALLIDDQKDSTAALTNILERRDFNCFHATNLKEASAKLAEVLPHLLIVDIHLGLDENGLDWLREIRKGPYAFIPAIVLTGSADEAVIRDSVRVGIDDYIVKPSEPQVLTKKVVAAVTRLQKQTPYEFVSDAAPMTVPMSLDMQISAISETGLCLSSYLVNPKPVSFAKPTSPLFEEMDVSALKQITFLNYEKESTWKSIFPMRNYCQANGWSEPDFKKIRVWIRKAGLGRYF